MVYNLGMMTHEDVLKEAFKDPEVKRLYDDLEPEFAIIRAMIERRIALKLSQSAFAKKVKTKQSAISRLESGEYNPTLKFMKKVAKALDCSLVLNFKPNS